MMALIKKALPYVASACVTIVLIAIAKKALPVSVKQPLGL